MSNTHADILQGRWYRKKYYIDDGFIKPVPGARVEPYNIFDFYLPGNRQRDSIHQIFASVDLNDDKAITGFYTRFGPLGLYNREIIKIVAFPPNLRHIYRMPESSPVAGVQRDINELMPMDMLMGKYHIPRDVFPIPIEGDLVLPDKKVATLDTWEPVDKFREECIRFRWILELRNAIADKNIMEIKELLESSNNQLYRNAVKGKDDNGLLYIATGAVMWAVNGEMENRVTPLLMFDERDGISKKISWRCDSLLTALYTMIFLDITRGVLTRRCENEKCTKFFEAGNPKVRFCSTSCQSAVKTQRYRDKKGKKD
jgi:hypothetical protein